MRQILETAYLAAETPWQQSGKSGTLEDWTRARQPISRCIERPGTVLDMGCANGFLLECLLEWSPYTLTPYGLDISPSLIEVAKKRLERYRDNFFVGNAWDWQPPRRFDYVRTELEYVPLNYRVSYLHRLLKEVVSEEGRLLVTEYWTRRLEHPAAWVDGWLRSQGFHVERCESGFADNGREVTRVAVVSRVEV